MIRDEEIKRLIKYAQGMGLSVSFKPYVKYSKVAAEWYADGPKIVIYVKAQDSKIDKILSLIHELGHHKSFIENGRQTDPKVQEALNGEDEEESNSKRNRKRILDMEIRDSMHWETIYNDTNCTFDITKLYKQRELDIWAYEHYYETGEDPTKKEKLAKRRELRRKWKC